MCDVEMKLTVSETENCIIVKSQLIRSCKVNLRLQVHSEFWKCHHSDSTLLIMNCFNYFKFIITQKLLVPASTVWESAAFLSLIKFKIRYLHVMDKKKKKSIRTISRLTDNENNYPLMRLKTPELFLADSSLAVCLDQLHRNQQSVRTKVWITVFNYLKVPGPSHCVEFGNLITQKCVCFHWNTIYTETTKTLRPLLHVPDSKSPNTWI